MSERRAFLTVAEMAEELRVSERHVKELIDQGVIEAVHLSPRVTRIPSSELERLATPLSSAVAPVSDPSAAA